MMNIDLTNIGIIERDTFRDCSSLKSVLIDDNSSTKANGKATIDKNSIKKQCDKGLLKNIVLSNSLTAIGNNAFSECKSLESVDIPASVVRIGTEVFMNCENLETVVFKDNTTGASMGKIVGKAMFFNCTSLKTVELSNDITTIESNAFSGCISLDSVEIPANVMRVGAEVFMNCENLETVVFKDNTTGASMGKIVGEAMFLNCKSLKTVLLSNDLQKIEEQAFLNCTALEQIEIPENVKEIKDRAFYGCESLKTVVIIAKEPPLLGEGVFPIEGISFKVPKGSIEKYRNENCWFQYKGMIQEA